MIELDLVEHFGNMDIFPGQRVEVYDPFDGKEKKGTVTKRYGKLNDKILNLGNYPDLVDVRLDDVRSPHIKGEERYMSCGHFTYGGEKIKKD